MEGVVSQNIGTKIKMRPASQRIGLVRHPKPPPPSSLITQYMDRQKGVAIKIWDSVLDMAKEIVLPNFFSPPPPPSSYPSNKNVLYQKLSAGLQTRHSKKRIELQLSLSA